MAGSSTPPFRSYLRPVRSGPPAMVVDSDSSSEDESTTTIATKKSSTQPKPIPRSVSIFVILIRESRMM